MRREETGMIPGALTHVTPRQGGGCVSEKVEVRRTIAGEGGGGGGG